MHESHGDEHLLAPLPAPYWGRLRVLSLSSTILVLSPAVCAWHGICRSRNYGRDRTVSRPKTLSRRFPKPAPEELEADTERRLAKNLPPRLSVKKPASPEFLREFPPGCGSLVELRDTDMNFGRPQ